jgi:hypothetical protein
MASYTSVQVKLEQFADYADKQTNAIPSHDDMLVGGLSELDNKILYRCHQYTVNACAVQPGQRFPNIEIKCRRSRISGPLNAPRPGFSHLNLKAKFRKACETQKEAKILQSVHFVG